MNVQTPQEKKRQYNKTYNQNRNAKRNAYLLDVKQVKTVKKIEVEYPGCAFRDRMSKAEFDRHPDTEFPSGTRIFMGDKTWIIK